MMGHSWVVNGFGDEKICEKCAKVVSGETWAANSNVLLYKEECRGKQMLRKDLKPGDVFRYKYFVKGTWYVPPRTLPISSEWRESINPGMDSEVELISSEPEHEFVPAPASSAVSPLHYVASCVEPIDAIEAWGLNFRLANVVKYVARAGKKPGVDAGDDLRKARAYLSREIAALEGRRGWE